MDTAISSLSESIESLAKRIRKLEVAGYATALTPGSGAPSDAQYLVLDYNAVLTDERKFQVDTNLLSSNDLGAGSTYTVSVDGNKLSWTSGKLIINVGVGNELTLVASGDYSLTVSGASTINGSLVGNITGGGTIATGGFTLTVPATGTSALGAGTLTVSSVNDATIASHTHAITSVNSSTAAANLLSCNASGYLQLIRLGLGVAPSYPLHVVGQAYVNANSTTAFVVEQDTVKDNVIVVDTTNGRLGINCTPSYGMDLIGTWRSGSTTTDATNKLSYFTSRHYTNAEQEVMMFVVNSQVAASTISIGGGSGSYNCATVLNFYTAVDNVTLTGTLRGKYDAAGLFTTYYGLFVDGVSDMVQARIQAHSTQNVNIFTVESSGGTVYGKFDNIGRLGLQMGATALTAYLHIAAGTASASTAPIKLTSGVSLTAPEVGTIEFTTDDLFFTITTGTARKRLLMADPTAGLTSGRVPFATTNGRLTDDADFSYASDVLSLKVSGVTDEGGYFINVVAGENLTRGEVVYVKQASGADGKVWKNPIDGDMPIGVVYANASADAAVKVIVSGIAYVLPTSGVTATRGYVIYSSASEAGRVDEAATVPAALTHWKECGHWLDTGGGAGTICRAIIHFN